MATSRSLTRMPVYDVSNGRIVGRVHRLIVDPDARKVIGLLLATRLGKEARCLPFRNIHSIGEHAVTVRGMDAITRLSDLPDMEEVLRSQRRIYHSPILSEDGSFVGDVDEFTINAQSGRIDTLLISGGLIHDLFRGQVALPAHLVVTIGEDATIVRDQAVVMLKQRRREQLVGGAEKTGTNGRRTNEAAESTRETDDDNARSTETKPDLRQTFGQRLRNTFTRRRRAAQDTETLIINGAEADDRPATASEGPSANLPNTDRPVGIGRSNVVDKVPSVGQSASVRKLSQETGLQEHVVQDSDDVIPPVAGDGREGGDGKL